MGETPATLNESEPQNRFFLSPLASVFLLIASLAGMTASLGLLKTELHHLADPTAALNCDISILVGCSSSILSPEAHLFLGLPNTAMGIGFYAVTIFVALLSLLKVGLPRLVWNLLAAGGTASLALIVFFLWASIFKFQALCPYCLVIWGATFVVFSVLTTFAAAVCRRPQVSSVGRPLHANAWAVVVTLVLLTVIAVVLGMTDKIAMLL
ncbi:MAG: vitamin K epoxide reductase family protein [Actinomycetaceae bacterium]|nr:vitamin K epoxide reductase family protein [Actinomycetaceae bacterium]